MGLYSCTCDPVKLPRSSIVIAVVLLVSQHLDAGIHCVEAGESEDHHIDIAKSVRDAVDSMPRDRVLQILSKLGFRDIELGPHFSHKSDEISQQFHDASFCTTRVLHTSKDVSPVIFLEEDNSVSLYRRGDAVECICDEYDCSCSKQCFCKTQSEPFPTTIPSKCPVCPDDCNDDSDSTDNDKSENEAAGLGKPNPAPYEFKCSCSFDGSGLSAKGTSNSLDCDCKNVDCQCSRKCKCRVPA